MGERRAIENSKEKSQKTNKIDKVWQKKL